MNTFQDTKTSFNSSLVAKTSINSNSSNISMTPNYIRILVVEDEPINQKVISLILKNAGYAADLAGTGQQALFMAQQNAYDIILLDIGLPDIDGFEVSRVIRKEQRNDTVLIVAYTAHTGNIEARCIEAGINDLLCKPSSPIHLCQRIESLLELKSNADALNNATILEE